jgi:hypothetical protein
VRLTNKAVIVIFERWRIEAYIESGGACGLREGLDCLVEREGDVCVREKKKVGVGQQLSAVVDHANGAEVAEVGWGLKDYAATSLPGLQGSQVPGFRLSVVHDDDFETVRNERIGVE